MMARQRYSAARKAMNDFSRLFYDENILDLKKFNDFYELPADINDNERTKRIHKKQLFIKNLDLSDKKTMEDVNYLFFNNNFDSINNDNDVDRKISYNEIIEQ